MKQLRFRIWDIKQKKFIFEYEASHLRLAITLAGKVYRGEDDNILPESDYVIQQYTGLNDINDIEIYEGDIISGEIWINDPNGKSGYANITNRKVFFKRGCYFVEVMDYLHNVYKCEVVGNIYENPELLKQ